MLNNIKRGVMIEDAARELNIGRNTLFSLLRKSGYFTGTFPRLEHIRSGLFFIEERTFTYAAGSQKPYHVALVTPTGMALLQELINDLGTKKILSPEQQRPQNHRDYGQQQGQIHRMGPRQTMAWRQRDIG